MAAGRQTQHCAMVADAQTFILCQTTHIRKSHLAVALGGNAVKEACQFVAFEGLDGGCSAIVMQ